MKRIILIFSMLFGIAHAQSIGYWRYDTVVLQKVGGNSELKILNATRGVTGGVLTNMGNGRTAFVTPTVGVTTFPQAVTAGSAFTTDALITGTGVDYVWQGFDDYVFDVDSFYLLNRGTINDTANQMVLTWNKNTGAVSVSNWAAAGAAQGIFANSQINNYLDSLRHRPLNLYDRPDSAYGGGNSIMAPATDSAMMNRITRRFAIPIVNFGVSSTGIASTAASFFSRVNPGHGGMSVFIPTINNISSGKFVPKNVNTLVNGFLSLYVNSFVKSYIPASSLTRVSRHGTWSIVNPVTAWGGKFTTGLSTATANDSIVIHNIHFETALAIGLRMSDSVNVAGAHGAWYLRDTVSGTVVQSATFGTNQQSIGISDGTNNNFQIPGAIIINGLDSSKYYSLKIVSEQSTNTLAIDYIATLLDPVFCKPMVFYNATYLSAAQYASLAITQATIDSCNAKIDSIAAVLAPWGRPVYVINNPTFNPTTMTTDGLHWNDLGYLTQFRLLTDQISSFNNPSDGSLSNSYGQMYATINGLARTVGVNAGDGLRNVGGYLQNVLYTGFPGGGRATGGIASGEALTLRSNPESDGVINFGSIGTANESTKRWVVGGTGGGQSALTVLGNSSALSEHLVTATLAASGTGNLFLGTNSASTMQFRVFSGGAIQGVGSGVSYPGVAAYTLQIAGGQSYLDAYTGSAGIQQNFRASNYLWVAGSALGSNAMNINTSGRLFVGGTTSATALLHLGAGTATASTAPLKFTSGTNMPTAEAGAMEYNGAHYITKVNAVRMGVGANLKSVYASVGNVGTGEDDLQTFSVPAGTLSADGDYIEFTMAFSIAADATIRVYFGATQLFSVSALATDAVYRVTGQIVRTGAATQRVTFQVNGGATTSIVGYQTPTETLANALTLKATGEALNTNDVIQTLMTVKYFPTN